MPTASDIVSAAKTQINALEATSDAIDTQIDAIKNSGLDGPLSVQQLSQIDSLRVTQKQVVLGIEKLGLATLAALDNSEEIAQLTSSLSTVTQGLQGQVSKIASMDKIAQSISSSASDIAQLVTQIKALSEG